MQINENEVLNERTREILDYYRGLPERSSQEAIVEMLRELQGVHGCISPYVLEQAAEAAGVLSPSLHAAWHVFATYFPNSGALRTLDSDNWQSPAPVSYTHLESSISEIRIQQTERSCKQCSYNLHQKVNQY